jgi:hypothetical protein
MRHPQKFNNRKSTRKPFWLPASSFYFLVAGFSAASFFFVIGILHDDGTEPEFVVGGLVASGVLVAGVVVRELVLRDFRERHIADRKQLDANLKTAFARISDAPTRKLTLESNASAIRNIKTKSEAAMVFEKIPQGHREVFEMCTEYRKVVASEIRNIHPDSPRLRALIQGNEFALKTHKFHMLRWAELESTSLAGIAQKSKDDLVRTENLERAKRPLEVALSHYPDEVSLNDSLGVLNELLLTMKMREFFAEADAAASAGDNALAAEIYREALDFLRIHERSGVHDEFRVQIEQALAYYQ